MRANQLSNFSRTQSLSLQRQTANAGTRNAQTAARSMGPKKGGGKKARTGDSASVSQQPEQPAVENRELEPGKFQSESQSGLKLQHQEDGSFDLKMPNGYQFSGDQQGKVTGKGSDGPVQGKLGTSEDGSPTLSFKDKGTDYEVDLNKLDFAATKEKSNGSFTTQVVRSDGSQQVAVGGPKKPDGSQETQFASFDRNGQVTEKSDGIKVADGKVEVGGGQSALPLGQPGDKPKEAAISTDNPMQKPQYIHMKQAENGEMYRTDVVTASGVQRTTVDGTQITQLHNGVRLTVNDKGEAVASTNNGKGPAGKVKTEDYTTRDPNTGRTVQEQRYTFNDEKGNRYTMFSESMDVAVESKDGKVAQIAHPDGRVFTAARDDKGNLHTSEVNPSQGYQFGSEKAFHDSAKPGEMSIEGGKPVKLPYGMPATGYGEKANANVQNAPASGFVPDAFQDGDKPSDAASITPNPNEPQAGVKPGLWSRIKSVFTGEDPGFGKAGEAGKSFHPYHRPGGAPPQEMGGFPGAFHDPMGGGFDMGMGMPGMKTMMALNLATMVMPMLMFANPMMGFGTMPFF